MWPGLRAVISSFPLKTVTPAEYVLLTPSVGQAFADNVWEILDFDEEVTDTADMHDTVTNNSRITVPAPMNGRYIRIVGGTICDDSTSQIRMYRDGSIFYGGGHCASGSTGSNATSTFSAPVVATTGEYYELEAHSAFGSGGKTFGDVGTFFQLEILKDTFEGALVFKTGNQTMSGSSTNLTWDTETNGYDTNNYHDTVTNNSRLTIPAGTSGLVRVYACFETDACAGQAGIGSLLDGASFPGRFQMDSDVTADMSEIHLHAATTAPIAVTAGQYFDVFEFGSVGHDVVAGENTWFGIEELESDLQYCLVAKTVDQACTSGAWTVQDWAAETADVGGWHDNSTNNSRLTVPSGVTRVRLSANVLTSSASGQKVIAIYKNGTLMAQSARNESSTAGTDGMNIFSPYEAVTAGDYFELALFTTGNCDADALDQTWFCIEEVSDVA